MAVEEETWEQKEEPEGEGEGGGGGDEILASGSTSQEDASKEEEELMEEEEEEVSLPKAAAAPSDAPKKEHVNVVFIGHVGTAQSPTLYLSKDSTYYQDVVSLMDIMFFYARCRQINYWGTDHVSCVVFVSTKLNLCFLKIYLD